MPDGQTNNSAAATEGPSATDGAGAGESPGGVVLEYESKNDSVPGPAVEPPTYGDVSLRGAYWTIAFSLVNKVVAFASQVALTWFLLPGELGVVALALAISGVSSLLTTSGLISVLVQRQGPIEAESPQVFWLSLAMGAGAMLLTAACAPLAGVFFRNGDVVPVVLVITLCFPSSALGTIYHARLLRDLRFKQVAGIHTMMSSGKAALSVVMAAAGFGPYAIVVPLLLSQAGTSVMFRVAAGRLPIGRPAPGLWPALLMPTLWLTAFGVANALQMYGTNLVIGRYESTTVVGLYYWGFALSAQAMFLLAVGLRDVLFPTLAKLNDQPQRQAEGFRNALRLMTLVAVPVCVVQAVTADPLIRLLFTQRWEPVIPVVQYLSLAMLTQPMQVMALALLMALGRFRLVTLVATAQGTLLVAASLIGARAGAEREIAAWAGSGIALGGAVAGYTAFRQLGEGWSGLVDSLKRTIIPAIVSGTLAWAAGLALRPYSRVAEAVVAAIVLGGVYILLACVLARGDVVQLLARLRMHGLAARLAGAGAVNEGDRPA